jgi:phosphohistidine phosphatase
MKILYVLRHAKSDWSDASLPDFERPLNERGLKAAPKMGVFMRERGIEPDLIVSSPARRALETAQLVKEAAAFSAEIRFESGIYEASVGDLMEIVSKTDDSTEKLLIVGHNPGFENLVGYLTGEFHPMPTAALAEIELPVKSWKEITGGGKLKNLFKPKEI